MQVVQLVHHKVFQKVELYYHVVKVFLMLKFLLND